MQVERVGARTKVLRGAALAAAFALGAALLPPGPWVWVWAALVGLAGVVVLPDVRWRTGSLVVAAVAIAVGLLNFLAGLTAPAPVGVDVVRTTDPKKWMPAEPVLGYRLLPNLKVLASATRGGQTLYRVIYTSTADGMRATVPAPAGAETYLFVGSSFMFGTGLPDDETLPSQFAHLNGDAIRTVNFSAPGYSVNQLVRAFEVGLLDHIKAGGRVAAVLTWITPAQIEWGSGDAEWLSDSPRYVLDDNGVPHHTGSFFNHRLTNPIAGAGYLVRSYFEFARRIGEAQRQVEQADLFFALIVRLQQLARERLSAPLYVIYSWPDGDSRPPDDAPVMKVIGRLRRARIPLVSVGDLTSSHPAADIMIPYEGHPNLLTTRLVAAELKRQLIDRNPPK